MKATRLFIAWMMITIMGCGQTWADNQTEPKQKLTPEQRIEMQTARMQKKLQLDEATAAKFAPLYQEYLNALKDCHSTICPFKTDNLKKELTDEERDQLILARFAAKKKIIEVQELYYSKFKEMLGIKQAVKIFKANPHHPHKAHKAHQGKRGRKSCRISPEV